MDLSNRSIDEQEQRYGGRSYMEHRGPYSAYPSRQPAATFGSGFYHGPQSAPSSVSEYSFKHQRTQSSSTSSPYVSPRTEIPGYSSSAPNPFYQQQQQAREPTYTYQQTQPSEYQPRHIPQLSQPVPFRQQQLSSQPQSGDSITFPRALDIEDRSSLQYRNTATTLPTQPIYYPTASLLTFPERSTELVPSRLQPLQPPLPNVLPPLESTITPGHTRGALTQARSDYVVPSIEAHAFMPITHQVNPERGQENFAAHPTDYTGATQSKHENG